MDRARPLRGPPPGVQARLLGPLGPRAPGGPSASALPVRPREDRDSVCPPKLFSLNYMSSIFNKSYSPALGSCPDTCALPQEPTWPLPRARAKQNLLPPPRPAPAPTPRHALGVREGKEGKAPGSSISPKTAHWMLLNHMTLPVSHRFEPKKLAISCHST